MNKANAMSRNGSISDNSRFSASAIDRSTRRPSIPGVKRSAKTSWTPLKRPFAIT
jgi:hypothetical protein